MRSNEPIRGCGTRVPGGVYATTPTSPYGRAVEDFLVDPPRPVDPDGLGLSNIGVKLIRDAKGVTHVLDRVGKSHYPNVADFIEEVRAIGMSRRLPRSLDFAVLSRESTIILVHDYAWIQNAHDYYVAEAGVEVARFTVCPKHLDAHSPDRALDMCARLFWQDVDEERRRKVTAATDALDIDTINVPGFGDFGPPYDAPAVSDDAAGSASAVPDREATAGLAAAFEEVDGALSRARDHLSKKVETLRDLPRARRPKWSVEDAAAVEELLKHL